ncbi:hypothetical protein [Phyllobacterium chamaecytisi]|uniref:hypothetical protein n=1 Tax=Phyllobacterium chamaecytisi TaxID=2876082 RepID=UPI001CCB51B2|nr:hypothetical protein [Phyllobacterium sp. KW56]MBZ9600715.1 hypothetical protein [Phyllobacterium sp. KW56]
MITRKSLADEIDTYDQSIADLNDSKKDCFDAYRDQLFAAGVLKENVRKEIVAVKAAIRRRRAVQKNEIEVEEKDALIDEIFDEINQRSRAPRTHVENTREFPVDREARRKQRMSESMDDNIALSAEMVADGLISEEAHAENIALSNAVARKYGNGPLDGQIDPKLAHTIVTGLQTEAGRAALITAVDIMIAREERIDPDTGEILGDVGEGQEAQSSDVEADPANAGGDDVDRSALRASSAVEVGATNSPETAHQVPAQDGGGTATGESPSDKSNAARPASVDAQPNVEGIAGQAINPGVTGGESATTNSPETANEMDRDVLSGGLPANAVPAENARKAIPETEDGSVSHAGADESSATNSETTPDPHTPAADDGQPGIHCSSPASAKYDGLPSIVGQDRESGVNHTGSKEEQAVDQFTPPAFLQKPVNLRPDCQHPSACAGYGSHQCHACTKAAQEVAA